MTRRVQRRLRETPDTSYRDRKIQDLKDELEKVSEEMNLWVEAGSDTAWHEQRIHQLVRRIDQLEEAAQPPPPVPLEQLSHRERAAALKPLMDEARRRWRDADQVQARTPAERARRQALLREYEKLQADYQEALRQGPPRLGPRSPTPREHELQAKVFETEDKIASMERRPKAERSAYFNKTLLELRKTLAEQNAAVDAERLRNAEQKKLPFDAEHYRRIDADRPRAPMVELPGPGRDDPGRGSVRCMALYKKGLRIRVCEQGSSVQFEAFDKNGNVVGHVRTSSPNRWDDTMDVSFSEVDASYRMDKVGTALYEVAAAYACEHGKTLASDETRSEFSEAFWRKQARKGRVSCLQDNEGGEEIEPDIDDIYREYGDDVADDMGYESVDEAMEEDPDGLYEQLYRIQADNTEYDAPEANYYPSPLLALERRYYNGDIDEDEYERIRDRLPEPEDGPAGQYWPCRKWGIDRDECSETMDLGKAKKRRCRTGKCGTAGTAALPPKPRGLRVAWTPTVAKNHARVRERCLASKPKCTTKYTAGKRVRKCWRECEELATRTVNRAKRTAAAAKKKSGRKKTAQA